MFPKIKLGKSVPSKNHFPLPVDSSSSFDWGFVQPLCKIALIPNSDITTKLDSLVRLSSMNVPTFGRVTYRTYHRFVPCSDLWQPFENMLLGKPYHTGALSAVPTSVPVARVQDLTAFVLLQFRNIATAYISTGLASSDTVGLSYTPATSAQLATILTSFNETKNPLLENSSFTIDGNVFTNQNDAPGSAFSGALKQINPNSADFLVTWKPNSTTSYMICFRLNQKARNLRKVLLGLGYQLDLENQESVSLLPIFAYYKAYYDLFAPQRETTWTSTPAYKQLDYWRENFNKCTVNDALASLAVNTSTLALFLYDCAEAYYTQDPDFVSAHIATPAITSSESQLPINDPINLSMYNQGVNISGQPRINQISAASPLTAIRVKALERLTPYVNKFTSAGGKLQDLMKSIFGADYMMDDRSYHIGSNVVLCQISDVFSTTENSDVALGEYAGRGIGKDEGQKFKYHTTTFGYYIALGCIAPVSGYCQAIDPTLKHRTKFEFYTGAFDALGHQITEKSSVFGANDVSINRTNGTSGSFGFIPRYSEYKQAYNILNGMLSLRSTRYSYQPYSLDKILSPVNLVGIPKDASGKTEGDEGFDPANVTNYQIKYAVHDIPIASAEWRYIGKYNWIGNFNRIFNNEGYEDANLERTRGTNLTAAERMLYDPIEDNFIVHNLFDIHVSANMLSMSDSFDTDNFDKDSISTEKA